VLPALPFFHVIATSLLSPERRKSFPKVLYNSFFNFKELKPVVDVKTFFQKYFISINRPVSLKRLDYRCARIQGIYFPAGGNPRLLLFLYDLPGCNETDFLMHFKKVLDFLTPMYVDIIDRLLNRGEASALWMLAASGGFSRAHKIASFFLLFYLPKPLFFLNCLLLKKLFLWLVKHVSWFLMIMIIL